MASSIKSNFKIGDTVEIKSRLLKRPTVGQIDGIEDNDRYTVGYFTNENAGKSQDVFDGSELTSTTMEDFLKKNHYTK